MITPSQIELIKATVPVLKAHGVDLTKHFYGRMLSHNPELKNVFNLSHQVGGAQHRALAMAVLGYAMNIESLGNLTDTVNRIAQRHCALDIRAEQYAIVGKHLLASIKEVLGDAATDELVDAWAAAYGMLADILIKAEQDIYNKNAAQKGGWTGWRPFVCAKRVDESDDVVSFYLEPADGGVLPTWTAGQYTTVRVFSKKRNLIQPCHYTISEASPQEPKYIRISVKHLKGKGEIPEGVVSSQLHRELQVGDIVELSAPAGVFTLDTDTKQNIVLLSAGIGITPMVAMVQELANVKFQHHVDFIYSTQNSKSYPLKKDVEEALGKLAKANSKIFFTKALPNDVKGKDYDEVGRINATNLKSVISDANNSVFYICGPNAFMLDMIKGLKALGVDEKNIHTEAFGTGVVG